ncbi:MAG: hypothetical protein R2816_06785 [Flavobacteriaceae bacterium]|nr:hypothetical protein [Flavobacteriaceae bacterium]
METAINNNQKELSESDLKEDPHRKATRLVLSSVTELTKYADAQSYSDILKEILKISLCSERSDDSKFRSDLIYHVEELLDFLDVLKGLEKEICKYLPRTLEEASKNLGLIDITKTL